MRRTLLGWTAAIVALVGAATALVVWSSADRREWTTRSRPALQAFQSGLDARMRFYMQDAVEHFRRAVELDPSFAAARVQLLEVSGSPEERQRMAEALATIDPDTLNERERFLVELALARSKHDPDRFTDVVDRFVTARPEDPWALYLKATLAWEKQEWGEAEALYQRLLQIDPNWVMARNHLGYLAMAQGRFADAEESFRTYAFVAPDQANPHDSLGELMVLVGRYDEAREELEAGLALRPDFCASYRNLIGIGVFEGRVDEIERVLGRVEDHCSPREIESIRCDVRMLEAYLSEDYDLPWRENLDACLSTPGERGPIFHLLALLTGRDELARSEEEAWRARLEKSARYEGKMGGPRALLQHLEGVRLLAEGDPGGAAERFLEADEQMHYWGLNDGRMKLYNRMLLAVALERAGDEAAARKVLDQVRAVNPRWAEKYSEVRARTPAPGPRTG
jgi:tetratricopeptide (TPR) repeat protein